MYSYDDVIAATIDYFNGDTLAAGVWVDKYALKDSSGNFYELAPTDMHERLTKEFARIEARYPHPRGREAIFEALKNFQRIVPQGSPMAAVGNYLRALSASNCVVVESPHDSIGGIFRTATQLAQLYKRRAGVGVDVSTLRPNGFEVQNAARTTTGPVSFCDLYSYVTRLIGQDGRRGALMLTMDVHHPDIEEFATMKADLKKVTGANVSVRLSDEFLEAVEADEEYEQRWPCEGAARFKRKVSAKKVWDTIVEYATKTAEPGLIFWDRMTSRLPAHSYPEFRSTSTNPCQPGWATVLTPDGIRMLSQVDTGDVIWSGKDWTKIISKWYTGRKEIFQYKTASGVFIGTNTHRVLQNGKKIQAKDATHIDTNTGWVEKIVSVESLGEEDVFDIMVDHPDHTYWTGGLLVSNCSEICLSPNDSCRLLSINLTGYVLNPFTSAATFDMEGFLHDVALGVRLADDLVDIEIELIDRILEKVEDPLERELWGKLQAAGRNGRRVGLGTHGLGDMLAQLNIKYDSQEALDFCDRLYELLRNEAYRTSIVLAKERGPFPAFNWATECENEYILDLPDDIRDGLKKYGRRNIALLTQAPTGSISLLSKGGRSFARHNISSGVEPLYKLSYLRWRKGNPGDHGFRVDRVDDLGDSWMKYKVYHNNILNWAQITGGDPNSPPDVFVESGDINWQFRVELQGVEQKYIDHSISSTINLPKDTSPETVGGIYMHAWKSGLKGVTVYVDGSRDGVLTTEQSDSGRPGVITRIMAPQRPRALPCDIHRSSVKGRKWISLVGLLNGEPYEMFGGHSSSLNLPMKHKTGMIVRRSKGKYALVLSDGSAIEDLAGHFCYAADGDQIGWITRLVSTSLRHGTPIEFLVEQLNKEGNVTALNKVLARVLKKYLKEGQKVLTKKSCIKCNSTNFTYQEGCPRCNDCGWTKC